MYTIRRCGQIQPNGLVRWTGYRFVVRQSSRCVYRTPGFVPLSKALYHTCFICGQRCTRWSRRSKLTSSVTSDVKPIIYIYIYSIFVKILQLTEVTSVFVWCLTPTEGNRVRGRPKRRWRDNIEEVGSSQWMRVAQDRSARHELSRPSASSGMNG